MLSISIFNHKSSAAHADTFPTTVLEALACGIPVVATAVGGIPEQVQDGITGFLMPHGDAETMMARIVQIREDDELRMGAEAAQDAEGIYLTKE